MSERELICIGCPMGCPIVVKWKTEKLYPLQEIRVHVEGVCKKGSN